MRHSHTSRNYAKAFFAFVTIGLVSACADSTVAPTTEVSFKAPAAFSRNVGVKVFRMSKDGGTERLGSHTINFPAGSICDPAKSTYGPTEWDKPCTPLKGSILITATMLEDKDGNPYIDFQPALRFVPTKEVNLFLKQGRAKEARELNVEYCNNAGVCIDESKTDASLIPQRLGKSSILVRRIKHFSGYSIAAGKGCLGELTEDLTGSLMSAMDGLGLNFDKRSGYMVASGLVKPRVTVRGADVAKRFDGETNR
jgi:hypothetical protein